MSRRVESPRVGQPQALSGANDDVAGSNGKDVDAKLMESVESTVMRVLQAEIPKLVEGIVKDQLKNIRDSQCLAGEEFASVRRAMEKVQSSMQVPSVAAVAASTTSSAHLMLAEKDAEDMMNMLNEWRFVCEEDEKKAMQVREDQAKQDEEAQRLKDLIAAWVRTWRRKRYPLLMHHRPRAVQVGQKHFAFQSTANQTGIDALRGTGQPSALALPDQPSANGQPSTVVQPTETPENSQPTALTAKPAISALSRGSKAGRPSQGAEQPKEDKIFGQVLTLAKDESYEQIDGEIRRLVEVYAWVESVWDIAMLIGAQGHIGQHVFNAFLVFLTIFMQVVLCLIINDTFTQPFVTDVMLKDLKNWRTSVGHDVGYIDPLTEQTLVSRICSGHTILPVSSSVAEIFQMTMEYTGKKDLTVLYDENPVLSQWWIFDHHYIGAWLSAMSCCIWWMIISQDVVNMMDLMDAVSGLPVESTVILKYEYNRRLNALSRNRRTSIYLLLGLRFIVCMCMLLTGTIFMLYTVSLTDLLLNAAALSIILELDNLIFVAFAPGQARALIASLLPIPRHHTHKIKGVALRYPAMLLTLILFAILVFFGVLKPQADKIEEAQREICGGNIGFTSTIAANGVVVATSQAISLTIDYEEVWSKYAFQALRQLIDVESPDHTALSLSTPTNSPSGVTNDLSGISVGILGTAYSMSAIADMGVGEITAYWNTDCSDAPGLDLCPGGAGEGCWQMFVMHNLTRDLSIRSCSDVQMYCGADSLAGVRARQYCPITCACDDPFSEYLFPDKNLGCPRACFELQSRLAILDNTPCVDQPNTYKFENYVKGMNHSMDPRFWPAGQRAFAQPVQDAVVAGKCEAVKNPIDSYGYDIDLCSDFNWFHWKPLTLVCPVACKCANKTVADLPVGCPKKCIIDNDHDHR
jgi:hypothetical protein